MNTYHITEKQNLNSVREGKTVELPNLAAAKRFASKNRAFYGTVLTIEQNGQLVAYKDSKWTNLA